MRRVLIYGAGEAGVMVLEEILKRPEEKIGVFGFVDDDPVKIGTRVRGVKVLGGKHTLVGWIRNFDINEIIIAMPSIEKRAIREVVKVCKSEKVKLLIVPSTREIIEGTVRFDQIKSLDLADLLDREEVRVDAGLIRASVEGKRVLVTGAAGSIGSVLVAELLRYRPATVIALDISENGLFYLMNRMKGAATRRSSRASPMSRKGGFWKRFSHLTFHTSYFMPPHTSMSLSWRAISVSPSSTTWWGAETCSSFRKRPGCKGLWPYPPTRPCTRYRSWVKRNEYANSWSGLSRRGVSRPAASVSETCSAATGASSPCFRSR
jgi:hypothetical protein